ncbi:MAG: hypothetical protein M5R40_07280 [Anaerolineae bacterium]|nr:hypothetical protein [Anaerolineae bacterium]
MRDRRPDGGRPGAAGRPGPGDGPVVASARVALNALALVLVLPASLVALASVRHGASRKSAKHPPCPALSVCGCATCPTRWWWCGAASHPPLGWLEIAVWLARGAGWGVFDAWGDLAGLVIAFPLAGVFRGSSCWQCTSARGERGVGRRLVGAVGPAMLAVRGGQRRGAGVLCARRVRGAHALAWVPYAGGEAALMLRRG